MRRKKLCFLAVMLCVLLLNAMINLEVALAQGIKFTTPLSSLTISPAIVEYRDSGYTSSSFRIAMNGRILERGTDYSLSFINDGIETKRISMPGVYDVVVIGMGNYSGEDTVTLTIHKRVLTLELSERLTKVEDGKPVSAQEVTSETDFNPRDIRFIWEKRQGIFYKKLGSAPSDVGEYRLRAESDVYDVTSFSAYFEILPQAPIATVDAIVEYKTQAPSATPSHTAKTTDSPTASTTNRPSATVQPSATIRPSATAQPSASATPIVQPINTTPARTNTSIPDDKAKPSRPIVQRGGTEEQNDEKARQHLIPFLNGLDYYRELFSLICIVLLTTLLILVWVLIKRRRKMVALRETIHDNMFDGSSTVRKDNGGEKTPDTQKNNGEKTLRIRKSTDSKEN